jgi:hypothetical protein
MAGIAALMGIGRTANAAAVGLYFTKNPVNATAGTQFTSQPEVHAVNADGTTDATYAGDITLTATPLTGTPGGILTGTTTLTAGAGIATFIDLAIDKPGQYKLTASAAGLTSGSSTGINIGTGVTLTEIWSVQPDTNNDKTLTITGINQLRSIAANHTPGHPFAGTIYITRRRDTTATQQGGTADVFYWKGNHTLTPGGPNFAVPDGRFDMAALAATGMNVGNACWAISVADDGYVYVNSYNSGEIARFNPDGTAPVRVIAVSPAPIFRQIYATGSGINTVIWGVEGSAASGQVYKFTATAVDTNGAPSAFATTKAFPFNNGDTQANINEQCVVNHAGTAFYYTKGQLGHNKASKLDMSGVVDATFYANESGAGTPSSGAAIDSQDRVLYIAGYTDPYGVVATDPVTGVDLTTNTIASGTANAYTPSMAASINNALYDFVELSRYSDRHFFYLGCNRGTAVIAGLFSSDVPAADPTGVLVENPGTGSSLQISWTPAIDPEIKGVNIYRSTTQGVIPAQPINSTPLTGSTYTDNGLTSGTTYYYTVRSSALDPVLNTAYEGASTAQVAKTASLAGIPDPPSAATAADTKQGGQILVSWTNPPQFAEKINIYRSTAAGTLGTKVKVFAPVVNGAAASWTDNGLTNGTPYFYTVRAANGTDQETTNTAQVSATPTDQVPPTFAGVKTITEYGMPGYRVTWDVATDNSLPITFKVYVASSPAAVNWNAPAVTTTDSKCDLTVPLGQDAYIFVRATDAAGNQETNTKYLVGTPSKVIVDSDINSPTYNSAAFNPQPDPAFPALQQTGIGSDAGKTNVTDLLNSGTLQGVFWLSSNDKLGKCKYTLPITVAGTYDIDAFWTNWATAGFNLNVPGYVYHVTYPNGATEDIPLDELTSSGGKWNLLKSTYLTVGNLVVVGDATGSFDTAATSNNASGAIRAMLHLAPAMVNIYRSATPPTIDGNITNTEYAGVSPIFLGQHYQDVVGGPWNGPADYSGNAYVKWDTNNLYIAYDVTDATPEFPATADTAIFNRDSLEIYFGLTNPQDPTRTTYDAGADFQLIISADYNTSTGAMTPKWFCPQLSGTVVGATPAGVMGAKKTAKGYTFEIAIPWTTFVSTPPVSGQVIGFNLSGNNTQTATSTGQDNAFVLSALGGSWGNPSHWVQATLLASTPPAIAPGDVNMDGSVTFKDAVAALRIAAGFINADDASVSFAAANINVPASGKIGVPEAVKILRKVNGK